MTGHLQFASRTEFRAWLQTNGASSGGVWLLLGKPGGPTTVKAGEALEEALCFGWVDGQMKSIDAGCYIKYFAPRRSNSKWSEKNKALVQALEKRGLLTDSGRAAVDEAKANGQWYAPKSPPVTDEQVDAIAALLAGEQAALEYFLAMPPSHKRTYARAYFDAKTEAGRTRRLAWMTDRLNRNLKPM